MTHRWVRIAVSSATAAMLSISLIGAVGQPAAAKEPKLSPGVTAANLAIELTAKVWLNPVAKAATVDFGKAYKSRVVTLQTHLTSNDAAPWVKVGKATKLSSSGKATFTLAGLYGSVTYRAVVDKTSKKPAMSSTTATVSAQWKNTLNEDFSSDGIGTGGMWSDRGLNVVVPSRLCSVPSNGITPATGSTLRSIAGGQFVAGIVKHTGDQFFNDRVASANPAATAAYNAAMASAQVLKPSARKAAEKIAKDALRAAFNCPSGAFENTAISTSGNTKGFKVNTGTPGMVSARVKFPLAQGMHGSVWLQSSDGKGGEIDFIESFGYGSGITSYVHIPTGGSFQKVGGYVLNSKKNNKSWWAKAHDFSVEWTASTFTFRVDGAISRTVKRTLPDADYFLVVSLLTSDWELARLTKPIGGGIKKASVADQKMLVDSVRAWTKA